MITLFAFSSIVSLIRLRILILSISIVSFVFTGKTCSINCKKMTELFNDDDDDDDDDDEEWFLWYS